MRLLRGEDLGELSREIEVPPPVIEEWRKAGGFSLDASVRGSRRHPACPLPAHAPHPGRSRTARPLPPRFLAALARLIPPPRVYRHCYHGVLAPNAALRERVTALARDAPNAPRHPASADPQPLTPAQSAARSRWACLLAHIYEVFPLICPDCGAEMRILAFLTAPFTVTGILRHAGTTC